MSLFLLREYIYTYIVSSVLVFFILSHTIIVKKHRFLFIFKIYFGETVTFL